MLHGLFLGRADGRHAAGEQRAAGHVLQHGHERERLHDLERACNAEPGNAIRRQAIDALVAIPDLAGARPMHAGDEIDQRRLAGAVGTDQADDLTRPQFERDVVDGDQAAEAAGYVGEPQHGGHGAASPVRRRHQGFAHPAPRNPLRQEQHETHHDDAEQAGMKLEQVTPDQFLHQQEQDRPINPAHHRADAAKQDHDDRLHRQQHVIDIGRIDVVDPGRVDAAAHARKHRRQDEGHDLVAQRIDPEHDRGVFVLLNAAQPESQAVMGDERRGRERRRGGDEHGVVEQPRLIGHVQRQHRQVQSHSAAGQIGRRVGDLAQHLGDHQARNGEVMAAQMQDGAAERGREQRDDRAAERPRRRHRHAHGLQHAAGIGAEAEKGGRGEGWISGKAADEIPAQRQRAVHQHRGRNAQHVVVGEGRQQHQHNRGGEREHAHHW